MNLARFQATPSHGCVRRKFSSTAVLKARERNRSGIAHALVRVCNGEDDGCLVMKYSRDVHRRDTQDR
jgi:hypothetical protein